MERLDFKPLMIATGMAGITMADIQSAATTLAALAAAGYSIHQWFNYARRKRRERETEIYKKEK